MEDKAYWIWLLLIFGPANPRIWELSKEYENVSLFANALLDNSTRRLTDDELKRIRLTPFSAAEAALKKCREADIDVICFDSPDYPQRFREIYNPPTVLFCRGDINAVTGSVIIGISGAREPSDYSRKLTDIISYRLSESGCVIASGLSDGIDKLAANSSVASKSRFFGVLGTALDDFQDKELIRNIAENGCVISETCSALNIRRPKFSERNRLLSAALDALIYIEGSAVSRGLEFCDTVLDHGKLVFVVPPHDITDKRYLGQSIMLRKGCKPFFNEKDVLFYLARGSVDSFDYDGYEPSYVDPTERSLLSERDEEEERHTKKKRKAPSAKKQAESLENKTEQAKDHSGLEGLQRLICDALADKPLLADAIADAVGADVTDVLTQLTMLELEGYVESLPGNRFGAL